MWRTATKLLSRVTFFCRCRRRWCEGPGWIPEPESGGSTAESTLCPTLFTALTAATFTAGLKQRLDELEAFLEEQTTEVTEYDEGLVRQLIEKITAYDDHLAFEFKFGLETEVQM